MPWDKWVLDATMGGPPFCFCPIEGDLDGEFSIVTGMNMLGSPGRNGKVVAVVHSDGQAAVDAFYAEHREEIDRLGRPCADRGRRRDRAPARRAGTVRAVCRQAGGLGD